MFEDTSDFGMGGKRVRADWQDNVSPPKQWKGKYKKRRKKKK